LNILIDIQLKDSMIECQVEFGLKQLYRYTLSTCRRFRTFFSTFVYKQDGKLGKAEIAVVINSNGAA